MLEKVDLSLKMSKDDSEKHLNDLQLKLIRLQQDIRNKEIAALVIYEGWDASGKGGSILRITQKLDPRGIKVWPVGPPSEEELSYNYLWRFWNKIPCKGEIAIFDRSWYGRVLVERVEKLAQPDEWKRAYKEICDFEQFLVDNGIVLIKFWMQISKDEQLKRFKEREADPYKKWKITPEDWRNREKWDEYLVAAEDMFKATDLCDCPWDIISAESKYYARVETCKIVEHKIKEAVDKAK